MYVEKAYSTVDSDSSSHVERGAQVKGARE